MGSGSTSRATPGSTRCRSLAAIRSGSPRSACRCRLRPEALEEPAVGGEMLVHVAEPRAHRVELEVGRAHRSEALRGARQLVVGHARTRAALEPDSLRIT